MSNSKIYASTDFYGELSEESILNNYINEIRKYPLLTVSEENELSNMAQKGDKAAREKLITSNLRLVVYWAKKYSDSRVSLLDLIQFGNIGLMRAIDKFDASKNVRFSSYASYWIKMSILRGKYNTGSVIRLPSQVANDAIKLDVIEEELSAELGHKPDIEDLMKKTSFSEEKISKLKNIKFSVTSLNKCVGDGESSTELMELISADKEWETEYILDQKFLHEDIIKALNNLPSRMKTVIILRFGLDGGKYRTLEEIGNELCITRERVRQIEKEALRRLSNSEDLLAYAS